MSEQKRPLLASPSSNPTPPMDPQTFEFAWTNLVIELGVILALLIS